jgi:hypothetical protein
MGHIYPTGDEDGGDGPEQLKDKEPIIQCYYDLITDYCQFWIRNVADVDDHGNSADQADVEHNLINDLLLISENIL